MCATAYNQLTSLPNAYRFDVASQTFPDNSANMTNSFSPVVLVPPDFRYGIEPDSDSITVKPQPEFDLEKGDFNLFIFCFSFNTRQ